jgi:hypothetical protein
MLEPEEAGAAERQFLEFRRKVRDCDFAGISAASLPPETVAEQSSLARLLMEKLNQMAEETASAEDERPVE